MLPAIAMRTFSKLALSLFLASAAASNAGCAADAADELEVSCDDGKCDSRIRSLVADAKKLDLEDLTIWGASYATTELNSALSVSDFASLRLRPTAVFASHEVAAQDLSIQDLDELVSGLTAQFGEDELSTEVNRIRAEHLRDASHGDKVFAESAFTIAANLNHGWNYTTNGLLEDLNSQVNIGFELGTALEARVIGAYEDGLDAVTSAPLRAINDIRGFVLPRSESDIRNMRPGESFALKGKGKMGVNIGVGVPILVAEPTSSLTYNLVLTAGLHRMMSGELDIQLVRMRDAEVVIDIGMEVEKSEGARIGIRDGWGVSGLVEANVDILGFDVDLGRLVEKALSKQLNQKLSLISAEASKTNRSTRLSVARMRFDLDAADPEQARPEALAQALKGDVRLAQALAHRGDSGVIAEFDLSRSGVSSASHAGIEILGMHFFRTTVQSEGNAAIQTPGGAIALLFESLHESGGWFRSKHGFTRVGLAGLIFDAADGGAARGETNFFLQVQESDSQMERDKTNDHLDSIIVSMAGLDAFTAFESSANRVESFVLSACPLPPSSEATSFDESCNIDLVSDPDPSAPFNQLKAQARNDFAAAISHMEPEYREFLMSIADLRLAANSIEDPVGADLWQTKGSVVVDYRLDDGALKEIMTTRSGADLKEAVVRNLLATQIVRTDSASDILAERTNLRSRVDADTQKLATTFDERRSEYGKLLSYEHARVETLGQMGPNAIEIRFKVDQRNRVDYASAVSQSIAQARSQLVTSMFDRLNDLAGDIDLPGFFTNPHSEQVVAYALLGLTSPDRVDIRVDIDIDSSGCFLCGDLERYEAAGFQSMDVRLKGLDVSEIGGGLFDINALIDLD